LQHVLGSTARAVLQRLYPGIVIDDGSSNEGLLHVPPK
jgi:hypothetical protein